MKFLILNTDYPEFLSWLYTQHPGLEDGSYEEQMRARVESLNSEADFYSKNLRKLGYEADDIFANNEFMQRAWARENGVWLEGPTEISQRWQEILQAAKSVTAKAPLRHLRRLIRPFVPNFNSQPPWFYTILEAQIKHYRPDVLYNQDLIGIGPWFLKQIKPSTRLLVGQHAATRLSDWEDWSCYDLIISSFAPTVDYFLRKGTPAELSRLAFEPRVLSGLKGQEETFDLTFVGSLHLVHSSRTALLETLCENFPQMKIWGPETSSIARNSPIRKCYVGEAWGREMYQILRHSKITLNHHGDVLPYANNMRLYEATGVGTLLVTDWKENLAEIFEPDREVVAYRSSQECVELIHHYLEHHARREAVALAGQRRTLKEHTYYNRMQRLVEILEHYMA